MAERKESIVENLAAAAIMGFIALLLISAALLLESSSSGRDRASIAELAGKPVTAKARLVDDPSFSRIFPIPGKPGGEYGSVFSLVSRSGSARAAALFSGNGELEAIRVIETGSARLDFDDPDWFSGFLGKGGSDPVPTRRALSRDPAAISGASESFAETSAVLTRLSTCVRAFGKERG
jgi:hypothetical protein